MSDVMWRAMLCWQLMYMDSLLTQHNLFEVPSSFQPPTTPAHGFHSLAVNVHDYPSAVLTYRICSSVCLFPRAIRSSFQSSCIVLDWYRKDQAGHHKLSCGAYPLNHSDKGGLWISQDPRAVEPRILGCGQVPGVPAVYGRRPDSEVDKAYLQTQGSSAPGEEVQGDSAGSGAKHCTA